MSRIKLILLLFTALSVQHIFAQADSSLSEDFDLTKGTKCIEGYGCGNIEISPGSVSCNAGSQCPIITVTNRFSKDINFVLPPFPSNIGSVAFVPGYDSTIPKNGGITKFAVTINSNAPVGEFNYLIPIDISSMMALQVRTNITTDPPEAPSFYALTANGEFFKIEGFDSSTLTATQKSNLAANSCGGKRKFIQPSFGGYSEIVADPLLIGINRHDVWVQQRNGCFKAQQYSIENNTLQPAINDLAQWHAMIASGSVGTVTEPPAGIMQSGTTIAPQAGLIYAAGFYGDTQDLQNALARLDFNSNPAVINVLNSNLDEDLSGAKLTGLAYNPKDTRITDGEENHQILFAVSNGGEQLAPNLLQSSGASYLYSISLTNGLYRPIQLSEITYFNGIEDVPVTLESLEYGPDGNLYAGGTGGSSYRRLFCLSIEEQVSSPPVVQIKKEFRHKENLQIITTYIVTAHLVLDGLGAAEKGNGISGLACVNCGAPTNLPAGDNCAKYMTELY